MNQEDIFETTKELIIPHIDDASLINDITIDTSLTKDLDINSASVIDVVMDFEEHFKVEIDDETLGKIDTLGDIIDVIKRLKVTA